jgi:hypothetical protein
MYCPSCGRELAPKSEICESSETQPPSADGAWDFKKDGPKQLAVIQQARANQDTVIWSVYSIFWAVNALLLNVFFHNGQPPVNRIVASLVAIVGVVAACLWLALHLRGLDNLKRLEGATMAIENGASVPVDARISRPPRKPLAQARTWMSITFGAVGVAWLVALAILLGLFGAAHGIR